MSDVVGRNGRPYCRADCVTCGAVCPSSDDKPEVQQRWARKHAADNPGHSAHAVTERTRVYKVRGER